MALFDFPRWKLTSPAAESGVVAPDERLSAGQTLVMGVQHAVAMFGATVLMPLLMGLDPNLSILMSGVGTLLFFVVTGGRVPSYLGSSAAFVGVVIAITGFNGQGLNPHLSVALGGIIACGLVYTLIGLVVMKIGTRWIERLMPPVVTGAVVMAIGLNLAPIAVRSVSAKPIFVTFTCDQNGRSISGTDITAALLVLQGMGIDAFGLNCSAGPDQMLPQLRRLREYARIPLIAKPNAGMPTIVNGKAVYDCTPEQFTALVPDMLASGVMIFGGCCGTTPEHIAALRGALDGAAITPPAPLHTDLLPAATEKLPALLPADAAHGPVLDVTPGLEDALSDALERDDPMVALRVASMADVNALAACQYLLTKPLCLVCGDAAVREQALRVYQGRALYEGGLSEEELKPLAEKYGVIG